MEAGEAIPSEMELAPAFASARARCAKPSTNWRPRTRWSRRQGRGTFVATHAEQQVQYRFLRLLPDQGDANEEGHSGASSNASACAPAQMWRAPGLRTGDSGHPARRVLDFQERPPF